MEKAVHTQVGRRAAFGAGMAYVAVACWFAAIACGLTSCNPAADAGTPNQQSSTQQDSTQQDSTQLDSKPPTPVPESIDGLTPEQVVALLLKRCHGTLQNSRKMANCVIELGRTADDVEPELILLGSDGCMRVHRRDGTRQTQIGERAWHLERVLGEFEITAIEGDELQALTQFQRLLRATLLEPLYECDRVSRQGPTVFAVLTKGGETWRLEVKKITLADGSAPWFPFTLTGPPGKVTFAKHQHVGITNLPKQVGLGDLGRRWFTLEDYGLVYDPSVFTNPTLDTKPTHKSVKVAGFLSDPKIGEPVLRSIARKVVFVSPDPGDWKERFRVLLENGQTLHKQRQQAADLDFLFDEGGKRFLAQPFMMADPDTGGRPFVKMKGQRVERLLAHEAVLVYPPRGSVESCEKAARKLLDAFLAKNNLSAAGPLRIIPWVEVDGKQLTERQQENLRIGFELPVQQR